MKATTGLDNSHHPGDTSSQKPGSDLAEIDVSLTRSQHEFVETEAARSGCTTTGEYVRRLIHEAQEQAAHEEFERKLISGLESGPAAEVTKAFWENERARLRDERGPEADRDS